MRMWKHFKKGIFIPTKVRFDGNLDAHKHLDSFELFAIKHGNIWES